MQASVERKSSVRAPLLVAVVAGLHVVAVGAFLVIQGCGTKQPMVEPPPAPVLPPSQQVSGPTAMPKAVFQPPVAVEAAPTSLEGAGGQTYTVASGDSLSRIASRHGVSAREIVELNKIKDPNKLRVGQKLLMPSYATPQAPSAAPKAAHKPEAKAKAKPAAKAAVAGAGEYIVVSGDSLSRIASRQGTTVKALREANSLKSDMIRVGQKLVLPGAAKAKAEPSAAAPSASAPAAAPAPAPEAVPPAPAGGSSEAPAPVAPPAPVVSADPLASPDMPFEYTVGPGETLDDVARKFAVLKQEVMDFNGITDPASVVSGQKLKIPTATP